jgi:methylenetetrahydrofolate reductase (NADPH)
LVTQIQNLNCGQYLREVMEATNKADFCIGFAGYPEKHLEAPSLQIDLKRLKEKVVVGVDYVVAQMFLITKRIFSL